MATAYTELESRTTPLNIQIPSDANDLDVKGLASPNYEFFSYQLLTLFGAALCQALAVNIDKSFPERFQTILANPHNLKEWLNDIADRMVNVLKFDDVLDARIPHKIKLSELVDNDESAQFISHIQFMVLAGLHNLSQVLLSQPKSNHFLNQQPHDFQAVIEEVLTNHATSLNIGEIAMYFDRFFVLSDISKLAHRDSSGNKIENLLGWIEAG